jgi:aryl-alcohol dehydrogenase-like predicted oxidoreductase
MEKRHLGNTGITVAPLAFGGNVFGWTVDERTSFQLLDAFVDAGFNLIDTANSYSSWVSGNKGGESETIIGNWLKKTGKRDQVVVATKVGSDMGGGRNDLSRNHILQQVESSLRRLRTDYIDLYQSHYDDPLTPMEETLETYAHLVKEGKVRAIGASNFSAERLLQASQVSRERGYPTYQCIQPEYNLYDRAAYERELAPLVLERGLGVINYFSLANGFLTGKYRSDADVSKSPRSGSIKKYLNARGYRILKALNEVAESYHTVPASVSLAWLIARPGITAPIASATKVEQLQELVNATKLQLDQASIDLLNKVSEV